MRSMDEPRQPVEAEPPGTPTWVKVFAIVALVVVVLFVLVLLTGGHGPRRHGADDAVAASVRPRA
jgi:ABC-type transporter Mla subunit MlaD